MRKTIRNVTMVVPVLITSCHESLNRKSGPVIPHASTTEAARRKAAGRPVARAADFAKRVNHERDRVIVISVLLPAVDEVPPRPIGGRRYDSSRLRSIQAVFSWI